MSRPNVTEEIERLIDATSLLDVLTAIELICEEKSAHIQHNWQDKSLSRVWDRASSVVGKAVRNETVQSL